LNTKSFITGKVYDPDNVWYVANGEQVNYYNSNGAESEVLDVLYNSKHKKFLFVYPKNDYMKLLYEKWRDQRGDQDEKGG